MVGPHRAACSQVSTASSRSTSRGTATAAAATSYDMETWAREVIAVAEHACLPEPPIIVAHSMGGWVGLTVAADHADDLAGLILLDSMVQRADPEVEAARVGVAFGPLHTYPSARSRARPVPDRSRPTDDAAVRQGSRRRASRCARLPGGWTWKFDPRIFERRAVPHGDMLQRIRCRVSLFRAEHGLVSRRHRRVHVRATRPGRARRRGPARVAPHHARPADPARHRAPGAARRLGALDAAAPGATAKRCEPGRGWVEGRSADHTDDRQADDRRDVHLRRSSMRCLHPDAKAPARAGGDATDHRHARHRSGPGHARAGERRRHGRRRRPPRDGPGAAPRRDRARRERSSPRPSPRTASGRSTIPPSGAAARSTSSRTSRCSAG